MAVEREVVVVQEYGPEQAGEMVGWMNVTKLPREDEPDLVFANIAVARIADEGARYSYIYYPGQQEASRLFGSDSVKGFEYSAELRAVGGDGKLLDTMAMKQPSSAEGSWNENKTRENGFADSFYSGEADPRDGGVWALGKRAILETLKEQLDEQDTDWLYSALYYNLSMVLRSDMQLGDPNMHDSTKEAKIDTIEIIQNLVNEEIIDQTVLRNLTIFGKIPAAEIPEYFAESRRSVAQLEQNISGLQEDSPVGKWFLPVGHRMGGGRSWPYMDPTTGDENAAFGVELNDLKNKDPARATVELKRELKELQSRRSFSHRVLGNLIALAAAERAE